MDYKDNDNETIFMINENSDEAREFLVNKYKNIIDIVIKKYFSEYTLIGLDEKDLYQEGLIGLLHAIDTYQEKKDALFKTYATRCIENSIKTAIARSYNSKNKNLNDSVSLDYVDPYTNRNLYDLIGDPDVIETLISKEDIEELDKYIGRTFRGLEKKVIELKKEDYSNDEIATTLNEDKRVIENALFRIRTKLKEYRSKQ